MEFFFDSVLLLFFAEYQNRGGFMVGLHHAAMLLLELVDEFALVFPEHLEQCVGYIVELNLLVAVATLDVHDW